MNDMRFFSVRESLVNRPGPTRTVSPSVAASMARKTESVAVAHEVYGYVLEPVLET
jgi:hypothetical protein